MQATHFRRPVMWVLTLGALLGLSSSLVEARYIAFRFANSNRQALIGLRDGARKTVVLPDGSLKTGEELIAFRLAGGLPLSADSAVRQSLERGYLPIVRSEAAIAGVPIVLSALASELSGTPARMT